MIMMRDKPSVFMSACILRDLFLAPLIRHKNEACTTPFVMPSFNNCLSSSPAGSQFGRMRHKENARAPTFSHGALGFIVSFVLEKTWIPPPQKNNPDFLMTPFINKTTCQGQCQHCELSKTLTLPSFESKNIKTDVMFLYSCLPFISLDLLLPRIATTWNTTHRRRRIRAWYSITKRMRL